MNGTQNKRRNGGRTSGSLAAARITELRNGSHAWHSKQTNTGTRGKGSKIMTVADRAGLPLAIHIDSASPAEVRLVAPVLERHFTDALPQRLIGDKANDSDGLDEQLRTEGIEMIAPNRSNRRKTQVGRPLRRYRGRWKVVRLMAWLHNFRRIVTRGEVRIENYLGFVHLGCIRILLRQPTFMG